jgi:hypothetical protein
MSKFMNWFLVFICRFGAFGLIAANIEAVILGRLPWDSGKEAFALLRAAILWTIADRAAQKRFDD